MSETRANPLYCPYCAEEDLRPHEHAHGAWECRSCLRVFSVRMIGLLTPAAAARAADAARVGTADVPAGSAGVAGADLSTPSADSPAPRTVTS